MKDVIAYRYGLRPPLDWGEDCEAELRKQVDLWNALVGIEERHRAAVAALTADDPGVAALQARVDALRAQIAELHTARKRAKQAGLNTAGMVGDIAQHRAELGRLADDLKAARRSVRAQKRAELEQLEASRYEAAKTAYQQSGLWWCNYNAVIEAYNVARSRAMKMGGALRPQHYGRRRGRLTNQIQGGMSVAELFGGAKSQVQVAPLPDKPGVRGTYTTLTATVYTRDGQRRTVTWPMVYDRPIPDDMRIKLVTVTRERVAHKWAWHVVFTCARDIEAPARPVGAAVAVDLGWRRLNDGLRVATVLRDERGAPDFITLPESILDIDEGVRRLRGERDEDASAMLASLRALPWDEAPEPLRSAWVWLARAPAVGPRALARLCGIWRGQREDRCHGHTYDGCWQAEALARLDAWRSKDKKRWEAEANHRQRLIGRRDMIYHAAAARIVAGASVIVMDQLDLSQSAVVPTDGAAHALPDMARRYRVIASVHTLRHWIKIKAQRAGVPVIVHAGTSRVCWHCGTPRGTAERDARLVIQCAGCGRVSDQDVNDCRYMLREHLRRGADGGSARVPDAA